MEFQKLYEYQAAVRGFHVYQKSWQPIVQQTLYCSHEKENPFDCFAIKTCDADGNTVAHLPMEVSGVTKFLLDRGASVILILTPALILKKMLFPRKQGS